MSSFFFFFFFFFFFISTHHQCTGKRSKASAQAAGVANVGVRPLERDEGTCWNQLKGIKEYRDEMKAERRHSKATLYLLLSISLSLSLSFFVFILFNFFLSLLLLHKLTHIHLDVGFYAYFVHFFPPAFMSFISQCIVLDSTNSTINSSSDWARVRRGTPIRPWNKDDRTRQIAP